MARARWARTSLCRSFSTVTAPGATDTLVLRSLDLALCVASQAPGVRGLRGAPRGSLAVAGFIPV